MVTDSNGKVTFDGLPAQYANPLNAFSDEELRTNPLICLQALIRNAEGFDPKTDGVAEP